MNAKKIAKKSVDKKTPVKKIAIKKIAGKPIFKIYNRKNREERGGSVINKPMTSTEKKIQEAYNKGMSDMSHNIESQKTPMNDLLYLIEHKDSLKRSVDYHKTELLSYENSLSKTLDSIKDKEFEIRSMFTQT